MLFPKPCCSVGLFSGPIMIALHYIEEGAPFPPVDTALDEPNGLLAFGGDLSLHVYFLPTHRAFSLGSVMTNRCCGGHPTPEPLLNSTILSHRKALRSLLENKNTR